MGAANALAAYATWGGKVPPLSLNLLVYMALRSKDDDEKPWFGRGHLHLAEHALRRPTPIERADIKAVERAVAPLLKAGAISVERRAAVRAEGPSTVRYRLRLDIPRISGDVNAEDRPRPPEFVPDIPRISGSRPPESVLTSPGFRGTEDKEEKEEQVGVAPASQANDVGTHAGKRTPLNGALSEKAPPTWGAKPKAPTEAWQIIADALPEATPDEITKVQSALNNGYFGKVPGLGLLKTYAREGVKLQQVLAAVRETRTAELAEEIKQIRADSPKCPHGEPGGNQPHPTTGTPLCPQCRRGDTKPTPDRTDHAGDYQRLYAAATGHPADGQLLIKVANQISTLRRKGVIDKHIADAAALAALRGTDLMTQLRENAHANR